jgi:hypothetical protein
MDNLKELKDTILDIAEKNRPRSIPQHVVVSGDKGSGKSCFINALSREAECRGYNAIRMHYPYFLVETADYVIRRAQSGNSASLKSIIFIDDFDRLLQQLSRQEQYGLRAFLFAENSPMLVGTSTGIIEGFTDYRAPFYDAFRIFHISNYLSSSLSIFMETVSECDAKITEECLGMNMHYLKRFACLRKEGNMDVQTVINKMVEENLSIFRYAMDSLPKLQQQVLSGIALNSNAATSIIIRELTGLESSSISASLLRLEKKGLIVRIGEVKRNASYSVKDRLLAYWLKKTLSE